MKNVTDRLIRGSFLMSLANALINFLTIASTVILARFLTPDDYGLVAIATTLLLVLTSVTNMPLGEALIRHKSPGMPEVDVVWTLGFLRGLLIAAILAGCAYPVAQIYNDARLVDIMLWLSLVPLLSGLVNPRRFILQRDLNFNQEFILNLAAKAISFVATIATVVVFRSYWALIVGNVSFQLCAVVISYMLMGYMPRISFKKAGHFLHFSFWLTLGQIINTLNWRFEYLLIGKLLGPAQLGIYSVGNNLSQLPTQETIRPLKQTIYPGFARVIDDPARIRSAYQRSQGFVTAIALPVGIGVAVIAQPLVTLLLGEKWLSSIMIMQSLAAIFALQTLGTLVQALAMAKNENRLLFIRDTQMFFIRLPVIIVGLWFWGLPGIVTARIITGLLAIGVNMMLVRRLINLPVVEQLKSNARALASVAFMALCVSAVSHFLGLGPDKWELARTLAIEIAVGAISYVGMSMLLWLAMNKPNGPESELLRIAGALLSRRSRAAVGTLS